MKFLWWIYVHFDNDIQGRGLSSKLLLFYCGSICSFVRLSVSKTIPFEWESASNYQLQNYEKIEPIELSSSSVRKNGLVLSPPTSFFSKCNYFKIDKWWNWGQIDLYMIFFSQLEFFLWSSFHSCKSHGHWTRIMTKCILNRCQTVKFTANKRLCASVSSLSLFLRIFLTTVSIGLFSKGQNTIL